MCIKIYIYLYNAGAIEKSSHSIYLQDPYKMQASCQDHAYQTLCHNLDINTFILLSYVMVCFFEKYLLNYKQIE